MKSYLIMLLGLMVTSLPGCSGVDASFSEQIIPGAYQNCRDNGGLKRIDILDFESAGWEEPKEEEVITLQVTCDNGEKLIYAESYRKGVRTDVR